MWDSEEANIREVPLAEIWNSNRYFERFRNKQAYLVGSCKACPQATTCLAGCTSIAYSATGGIGHNPYCIRAMETETILDGLTDS